MEFLCTVSMQNDVNILLSLETHLETRRSGEALQYLTARPGRVRQAKAQAELLTTRPLPPSMMSNWLAGEWGVGHFSPHTLLL